MYVCVGTVWNFVSVFTLRPCWPIGPGGVDAGLQGVDVSFPARCPLPPPVRTD